MRWLPAYSTTPRNRNRVNQNHLGICLRSSQKNRNSLVLVACHYNENFLLLLTTSLDTKEDHNEQAAAVNRWIVLFVEDVTFLGLEISLLALGKKLNGLDWVIWGQALAFTLMNMIRNLWSLCRTRQRISPSETGSDVVGGVQSLAQAVATA